MSKTAKRAAPLRASTDTSNVIQFELPGSRRPRALPAGFFVPASVIARIDALTDKSAGPNGAWVWMGSRNQGNGYPQITFKDQETGRTTTMGVHRVLVCIRERRRLERTEYVLHKRGVPKTSVNPAHLRIGSQQENLDDARADKRLRRKLSVAEVLRVKRLWEKDGCDPNDIAHHMGISNQTVCSIIMGRTHRKTTGYQLRHGRPGRRLEKEAA